MIIIHQALLLLLTVQKSGFHQRKSSVLQYPTVQNDNFLVFLDICSVVKRSSQGKHEHYQHTAISQANSLSIDILIGSMYGIFTRMFGDFFLVNVGINVPYIYIYVYIYMDAHGI